MIYLLIVGIFSVYSLFMIVLATWGYAIIPKSCTNPKIRDTLRSLLVTASISLTVFISYLICFERCTPNKEGSVRDPTSITWVLYLFGLIISIVMLVLQSKMNSLWKRGECQSAKTKQWSDFNTWSMIVSGLMMFSQFMALIGKYAKWGVMSKADRKAYELKARETAVRRKEEEAKREAEAKIKEAELKRREKRMKEGREQMIREQELAAERKLAQERRAKEEQKKKEVRDEQELRRLRGDEKPPEDLVQKIRTTEDLYKYLNDQWKIGNEAQIHQLADDPRFVKYKSKVDSFIAAKEKRALQDVIAPRTSLGMSLADEDEEKREEEPEEELFVKRRPKKMGFPKRPKRPKSPKRSGGKRRRVKMSTYF